MLNPPLNYADTSFFNLSFPYFCILFLLCIVLDISPFYYCKVLCIIQISAV